MAGIQVSSDCFSASVPILHGSKPGTPWSIRINGMPVSSSRREANNTTCPIVACSRSVIFNSSTTRSTSSWLYTLFCMSRRIYLVPASFPSHPESQPVHLYDPISF